MFEKVIIHVGLHKTGTTSLQNYFGNNRKKLKSHGIAYPALSINGFTPNNHSWPILNITLSDPNTYHLNITNKFSGALLESVIASINAQFLKLKDSKEKTLLVSGEGISTLKINELENLKAKLHDISNNDVVFEVHYFIRNASNYISSVIQERLKGGTREDIIFSDFAKRSPFNHFLNLASFEKIFTRAVIKKHNYEFACAYVGGLERYFSEQILQQNKTYRRSPYRDNTALSNISFQLIRYYICHSREYVRVPIKGSNYHDNIKKLASIKGDKFEITSEQKNKLLKLTNEHSNSNNWNTFFEEIMTQSEKACWLSFKFNEIKIQLNKVDNECQQLLANLFRDLSVQFESENIKVSLDLMSISRKYRAHGKLISN